MMINYTAISKRLRSDIIRNSPNLWPGDHDYSYPEVQFAAPNRSGFRSHLSLLPGTSCRMRRAMATRANRT